MNNAENSDSNAKKKPKTNRPQEEYICKEYKTTHTAGGIGNLAAVQASESTGTAEEIPMKVTVSCGRPRVQFGDYEFTLAAWNVLIRSQLTNATIKRIRPVVLSKGQVKQSSRSELYNIEERKSQLAMKLNINIERFLSNGFLSWLIGRKGTTSRTERSVVTAHHRMTLIAKFGDNMILIGDAEYGDPYHPYGLLKHDYPRDETKPFLFVRPENPEKDAYVTLMTTVERHRLFVSPGRAPNWLLPTLEDAGHEAIQEHEQKVLATLRPLDDLPNQDQLRWQMIEDEIFFRAAKNQKAAGLSIGVGEIAIMAATFEIKRAGSRMN